MRTTTIGPEPHRLLALERANEIRRARAQLKRRISAGRLSAAEVILDCLLEASTWPVAELLASQRRWGSAKCRKFLARYRISEVEADRRAHRASAAPARCAARAMQPDAKCDRESGG